MLIRWILGPTTTMLDSYKQDSKKLHAGLYQNLAAGCPHKGRRRIFCKPSVTVVRFDYVWLHLRSDVCKDVCWHRSERQRTGRGSDIEAITIYAITT